MRKKTPCMMGMLVSMMVGKNHENGERIKTCDKADDESSDRSGRDGDDQGLEAEEDNARLHGRTVRP